MIAAPGFITALPSERTLDAGAYLAGAAELGLVLAALAFGAYRVRAALLPGWEGPPARLAEIVLGVVGLIWVSEAVGTFGGFERGPVIAAAVVVGVGAGLIAGRWLGRSPGTRPPAPPSWGVAKLVAAGVCAALAAAWVVPTLSTLASGMDRTDSLWYHLPLAARFVQTGDLGHIYFFDPIFLASFYPANSEVAHAVPMLFFGRDLVSPLINLGWLAVALLAGWSIGRPYGLGPQALIGALDRPRVAVAGRVPGGRGAQRHHRRRLHARRRGDPRQRLCIADGGGGRRRASPAGRGRGDRPSDPDTRRWSSPGWPLVWPRERNCRSWPRSPR